MQLALRLIAFVSFIVAIVWVIQVRALEPEPILAFLTGLTTLALSFAGEKVEIKETLDQHNRRVMLNHVESFWVKGVLEKSLHGAALLELGIKEDPTTITYPWAIKKESTNEILPAGKSMFEIFEEIGAGRSLLILGAPGSGKTTMLLELARQLIERARNDETEPIPVVFSLASWTEKQTLANWLAEQLNNVYYVPKKTGPKWVSENKMVLLLDGLDEVKQESRIKCVEAINQFRNEYGLTSLVISSRVEEYTAINTKLSLEGAITLQPLTSKQVNDYFDRFGKSLARVKQLHKKDKILQGLSETPLMLSVIALAYKDKKPKELSSPNNKREQRKHLFNAYIDRMFDHSTRIATLKFTKEQTLNYLSWLARKMIEHNLINYQIEAMQPSWLENKPQRYLFKLFTGILQGLFFGLICGSITWLNGNRVMDGIIIASVTGLFFGISDLLSDLMITNDKIVLKDKLDLQRKDIIFCTTIIFGSSIIGLILSKDLGINLTTGLVFGFIIGLLFGLFFIQFSLTSEKQVAEATYPGQSLQRTLLFSVFFALVFSIITTLGTLLTFGTSDLLSFGLTSLLVGIIFGSFTIGGGFFRHYAIRLVLTNHDILPLQLISFLEHAVALIFIRRVGGSYIFVHRLLMEHFAELEVEKL